MEYLLSSVVLWAVMNYFIVKKVMKHYPNLKVNPWLYAVGALTIGPLVTWIFLVYKLYDYIEHGKFSRFSK